MTTPHAAMVERAEPETTYEFVREWFAKAGKQAEAQGRRESAALWRDGLQHLEHMHAEIERLLQALEAERGWHPIGSAPHTPDAWFLVWHPKTGVGMTFWNAGKFYSYAPGDEPTHWMPFPPPPAATLRG